MEKGKQRGLSGDPPSDSALPNARRRQTPPQDGKKLKKRRSPVPLSIAIVIRLARIIRRLFLPCESAGGGVSGGDEKTETRR